MPSELSRSGEPIGRRDFVRSVSLGAVALALPAPSTGYDLQLIDPYEPLRPGRPVGRPVRVRGRVRSRRGGLARVGVSDGLEVVESAGDGSFEIITTSDRPYVWVCVPSGYAIPRKADGTAHCYLPLRADADGEMEATFDLEPLDRPDDDHVLLLLPDPQTEDEQEMKWLHEQTVPDVQSLVAGLGETEAFGIACGDIMYDNLELFPRYVEAVTRMGIPFFQVVGNHDLESDSMTDEASTATFSSYFGPRYYSFDRGEIHYVVLDDVFWHGAGYLGYLDSEQLRWLEADLARIESGSVVIVALHIPLLGSSHLRYEERQPGIGVSVTNRELLYRLLEPFRAHVLAGHMHENEHLFEGGVHEHVSGTVCGAWWSGPICGDGTPNGYSVYEVHGSEVSWRYKATGRAFDHQIRAYAHGADPTAPDEIVANVWDCDPAWRIVWYEDGERRGELARRVGLDPLAAELHTGPDLPPRRSWVEPYRTGHLFYGPASREANEIRIEALDRFGRTYSTVVPKGAPIGR